jgi:hypothetical protein
MAKSKYSNTYAKMDKSYAKGKNEKYMSKGMKSSGKVMGHDGKVYSINTNSEQYDMGKIRYDSVGTKGYPRQAFDYQY